MMCRLSFPSLLIAVLLASPLLAQRRDPHIGYVYPAGAKIGETVRVVVGGQFLNAPREVLISGEGIDVRVVDYCKPPTRGQLNKIRQKLRELQRLALQKARAERPGARAKGRAGKTRKVPPKPLRGKSKAAKRGRDGRKRASDRKTPQKKRTSQKGKKPKGKKPTGKKTAKGKTAQKRKGSAKKSQRRRSFLPGLERLGPEGFKKLAVSVGLRDFDLEDLKGFLVKFRDPKRQPNVQLDETVTLELKVAKTAKPGSRELRLVGALGLSNPIVFDVGTLPEMLEHESAEQSRAGEGVGKLPVVINGQILPGDVDRFAFQARKGQRIVAEASARRLVPYLADAVPGWFQATLALYDEAGKRVAFVDDYKFDPDPVLSFLVPRSGRYVLEIRDSIYRGREDFVYRIELGELPFVSSVFPLGGKIGEETEVALQGWNLPKRTLRVKGTAGTPEGIVENRVRRGRSLSNPRRFHLSSLSSRMEREPNNGTSAAQDVHPPILIDARIQEPGDVDVYRFEARKGQTLVLETLARRVGSAVDTWIRVVDAGGKQLALGDDYVDPCAGLCTHHADSRVEFVAPKDGTYLAYVGDTQGRGGADYAYRLRISPLRPDFELRVVPATLNLRPGTSAAITVHCARRDGFAGPVEISLGNGNSGFRLSGGWIPAGTDKMEMTVTAPPRGSRTPVALHFIGKGQVGTRELQRRVVPAEDRMQAFLYRHLVPVKNCLALVTGRGRGRAAIARVGQKTKRVPIGGKTWLRFDGMNPGLLKQIQFELRAAPKGLSIGQVRAAGRQAIEVELRCNSKSSKLGQKGNLILNAYYVRRQGGAKNPKRRATRRFFAGVLPAVRYVVGKRRVTI